MKFKRKLTEQQKELLLKQLAEYESAITLSKTERRELREWVAAGHSPYDNDGYFCSEDGTPLDYVSARRYEIEWTNAYRSASPQKQKEMEQAIRYEYNTTIDEPIRIAESIKAVEGNIENQLPEELDKIF